MGLRDIGESLPPGFRFYPSDEELVCHYLYKKIANVELLKGTLVEIDLHTCEPWQLPEVAKLNATEWYFFSFRDRKYATGFRTNRATTSGYWKATGKDRTIHDPITGEVVGMRKTLVFYNNRAPNGTKTGWIMHEFRLESPHMPPKEDWVLCRVFHKCKTEDNYIKCMYEATTNPPSIINTSFPPINSQTNTTSFSYQQQQMTSSLSSTQTHHHQNNSLLNLLQVPHQEKNFVTFHANEIVSSKGDDYELLWDINMEENSLGVGDNGNLEDMGFEIDNLL
ncbi:hypothetical protein ACFE04_014952 [Oxalis oulophora]